MSENNFIYNIKRTVSFTLKLKNGTACCPISHDILPKYIKSADIYVRLRLKDDILMSLVRIPYIELYKKLGGVLILSVPTEFAVRDDDFFSENNTVFNFFPIPDKDYEIEFRVDY